MVLIEEFRIGNYLLVDNKLRRVCCLENRERNTEDKLIGFENDDNGCEFEIAKSERFERVKINDQILLNLGFSFHTYFKLWQRKRPERTYSIELDADYFPLDFSHQPIVKNMLYLHQLQNLFFIIQGEELSF